MIVDAVFFIFGLIGIVSLGIDTNRQDRRLLIFGTAFCIGAAVHFSMGLKP